MIDKVERTEENRKSEEIGGGREKQNDRYGIRKMGRRRS